MHKGRTVATSIGNQAAPAVSTVPAAVFRLAGRIGRTPCRHTSAAEGGRASACQRASKETAFKMRPVSSFTFFAIISKVCTRPWPSLLARYKGLCLPFANQKHLTAGTCNHSTDVNTRRSGPDEWRSGPSPQHRRGPDKKQKKKQRWGFARSYSTHVAPRLRRCEHGAPVQGVRLAGFRENGGPNGCLP